MAYIEALAGTPVYTFKNVAQSQTDSSLVAAVANRHIRIIAVVMVCGSTATLSTFNSKGAGAGTAISMDFANSANGGVALDFNPVGWLQTNTGEALTINTGAGSTTGYQIVYVVV